MPQGHIDTILQLKCPVCENGHLVFNNQTHDVLVAPSGASISESLQGATQQEIIEKCASTTYTHVCDKCKLVAQVYNEKYPRRLYVELDEVLIRKK